MLNESELGLICDTFEKCHIKASVTDISNIYATIRESGFETQLGQEYLIAEKTGNLPAILSPNTIYRLSDAFGLCYIFLLLTNKNGGKALVLGPYLPEPFTNEKMLKLGERNRVSPKKQKYLNEYYSALPVVTESSRLFILLNSFCERIWETPSFAITDIGKDYGAPASPIGNMPKEENFDEILADMKTMEKRYEYENELIRAVTLGQIHKESVFISSFNEYVFEKRLTDQLRNAKNYCIIMNTLLRKAAEAGGVHPVYIDRISSDFASKIERMPRLSEIGVLMREMFKTYCRVVRNHTMKNYSELVKTTILLIDSDISAPLSAGGLAKMQNVSLGYLSTVFKKETEKTLTEYITEKRMNHAKHLLATTELQIQTVALHCGIMDLQYFSKLFKKHTGKTPKQYRESSSTF